MEAQRSHVLTQKQKTSLDNLLQTLAEPLLDPMYGIQVLNPDGRVMTESESLAARAEFERQFPGLSQVR